MSWVGDGSLGNAVLGIVKCVLISGKNDASETTNGREKYTYSVVVVLVVGPGSLPGNGFSQSPPGLETQIEYPIDARRDSLSQYVPTSGFQLISWDHVALYVLEIEEQVSDSATLCVSHLILSGMQRSPDVGN